MEDFAKLFRDNDGSQILVKLDSSDEGGPEVRLYFVTPSENLGVCSVVVTADDTEAGWDAMEQAFANIDEEKARAMLVETKQHIEQSFKN